MEYLYFIPILFFVIALLYSMVGFGGGSSYIAILLASGMAVEELKITALLCNIGVVLIASISFYRNDLINWKKLIPIIVCSIPLAFIGAKVQVDEYVYKAITGIVLVGAALLMLTKKSIKSKEIQTKRFSVLLGGAGMGIGFLSGFIGIGGGIFLSPLLYVMNWGKAKEISAICSVFILVNSISGIAGQVNNFYLLDVKFTFAVLFAVVIGGLIGNRLNIKRLKPQYIRILTAILIGYVGIRLLIL